jgi:hypothetical protein
MDEAAARVHAHFIALIDAPADRIRPKITGKEAQQA